MLPDGDATAEMHMRDDVVWRSHVSKQSWILCTLYRAMSD